MRVLFTIIATGLLCCCQEKDNGQVNIEKDSAAVIQRPTPNEMQRIMDSILKAAGPDAKITIEGEPDETDTFGKKQQDGTEIKIFNIKILDSLIHSSKKKYTLVHFWATWCKPCRKEFPDFLKDVAALKNVDVLLVSSDYDSKDQRKKVLAVYEKLDTRLPLYINEVFEKNDLTGIKAQNKIVSHYSAENTGGLPFTMLVDNSSGKSVSASGNYKKVIEAIK